MKTVQFKTNIKCSGCVAKVTPELDKVAGENNWKVAVETPDKILTVSAENTEATTIKQAVEKAGFRAEFLS